MKATTTRVKMVMTAAVLAAMLATPMVAAAAPGQGGQLRGLGGGQVAAAANTAKAKTLENLKERIANVLAARKARFDAVVANLNLRIDRVNGIADRVEKAGGDVSSARASLDAAQEHISKAKSLEAEAVAAFQAIPGASDKRAAFQAAREKARLAHAEVKAAREDIRAAAKGLREIVAQLKSQSTQTTTQ